MWKMLLVECSWMNAGYLRAHVSLGGGGFTIVWDDYFIIISPTGVASLAEIRHQHNYCCN